MSDTSDYLISARKLFEYYKTLGEKTFDQIPDEGLFWQYNETSNSIAIIVSHLSGNMLSRWTDFLTTDGEKEWRDRDSEFETILKTKSELTEAWDKGWKCLFEAIDGLASDDLSKTVYIRNMGQTVTDAINRQLAHYAYHVGQIVFAGKMVSGENWQSLSIPKGNSKKYNEEKFSQERRDQHFSDDYIKSK